MADLGNDWLTVEVEAVSVINKVEWKLEKKNKHFLYHLELFTLTEL